MIQNARKTRLRVFRESHVPLIDDVFPIDMVSAGARVKVCLTEFTIHKIFI